MCCHCGPLRVVCHRGCEFGGDTPGRRAGGAAMSRCQSTKGGHRRSMGCQVYVASVELARSMYRFANTFARWFRARSSHPPATASTEAFRMAFLASFLFLDRTFAPFIDHASFT